MGEDQANVPFQQRAALQEWHTDEEERRAALLNMQRGRAERGGDGQVSVSGSLSTKGLSPAAVK